MKKVLIYLVMLVTVFCSYSATNLYDNLFWYSVEGVAHTNNAGDIYGHTNFLYSVVVCAPSATNILDVITWATTKEWTPVEYSALLTWLTSRGSTVPTWEPLIDIDGEYITDVYGYLIFQAL